MLERRLGRSEYCAAQETETVENAEPNGHEYPRRPEDFLHAPFTSGLDHTSRLDATRGCEKAEPATDLTK
jgi:hypothetical protein